MKVGLGTRKKENLKVNGRMSNIIFTTFSLFGIQTSTAATN